MTVASTETSTLDEMFERVRGLGPELSARSAEFEGLNDLPDDVFAAIAATGVTRVAVPADLGGLEGTPMDWFQATAHLAQHDAAAAWIGAQGAVQNAWVAMYTETEFAREVLRNPLALPATSIQGEATLRPLAEGRFELSGHWRFLSGCSGATLIGGLAAVLRDDGERELRFVVVPSHLATIARSWDSFGLRGTGSHEATVGPLAVDAGQTWRVMETVPRFEHPLACFKMGAWQIAGSSAAVQVGIARRALDEARSHLVTKGQTPTHTGSTAPLAENAAVIRQMARGEGLWWAARAGAVEALREVWDAAREGPLPAAVADRCQLACATAVWLCADVITTAYNLGGTTAQLNGHTLQRCFRDGHTLTAHVSVNDGAFEKVGRSVFSA